MLSMKAVLRDGAPGVFSSSDSNRNAGIFGSPDAAVDEWCHPLSGRSGPARIRRAFEVMEPGAIA